MPLRAAELEVLVTVNDEQVGKAEKNIKATGERVEKKPLKVDADAKGALASLDRVEASARRIVSAKTVATVDANIERAEKSFTRVSEKLDYLRSVETELDVSADIKRAEASLSKIQRSLDGLRSARAVMEVDADTSGAEAALKEVAKQAEDAGTDGGARGGKAMAAGIVGALATIPIAGAIAKLAETAGNAVVEGFQNGLAVEVRYDRLAALAGLDDADALRIGNAAGEAYANAFGQSIEANMDTARLALQFDIIDEDATTRDSQKVIQGLSGIADVLGEGVQPIARAVTQMLRTGLVRSADEAFDILATGAREGVNVAEDLLDTFNEYPTQFRKLGLDGPQALGLLSQALKAGARDSDIAADALKEFGIRAVDPAYKKAFDDLGFSWDDLSNRISQGGPLAAAALDETLDKLRAIEDPALRNAAALEIFGTQGEDMAAALNAMDLSTAVEQLGGVEGAAKRMFDTLANNDATKLEQAKRNIEVALEGIQGALAVAFTDPLSEFADWVSQNRGPLLQFFADLVNGAIDFGISATESFGTFVSGPLADTVEGIKHVIKIMTFGTADTSGLEGLIDGMREFDETTDDAVTALEGMRSEFNTFADSQVALGHLNDAALRTADSIGRVGSEHGTMETQVRAAIAAISDEISTADAAEESQADLADRYRTSTEALLDQMVQTGLTREQAQALIDTVLKTPESASTAYSSNAPEEQGKVQSLADRIVTLPNGTVVITANDEPARTTADEFIRSYNNRSVTIGVSASTIVGNPSMGWRGDKGGVLEFMASGGLTPMQPIAQMVPANTWRVVGDRGDVPELYAPLDGSPRSWSLLLEGLRRMPGSPSGGGESRRTPAAGSAQSGPVDLSSRTIRELARELGGVVRMDQRRGVRTDG